MKILAIGGSGWIGSCFVNLALSKKHDVSVLSRGNMPIPDGATHIKLDRDDDDHWGDIRWDGDPASAADALLGANSSYDFVVDFIGEGQKRAVQLLGIDSRGMKNVLVSSDLIYSPRQTNYPLVELESRYQTKFYGGKKYETEWMFDSGSSKRYTTVLRANYLYGPGKPLGCLPNHLDDANLVNSMKSGKEIRLAGGGHFLVQPLYIQDFAETILAVGENPDIQGGRYNVGGPDTIEASRFYQIIGEVLGRGVRIAETPIQPIIDEHPELEQYLRHRFTDTSTLLNSDLPSPHTHVEEGVLKTLSDSGIDVKTAETRKKELGGYF